MPELKELGPTFKLRTSVSLNAKHVWVWEIAKQRYRHEEKIDTFTDFLGQAIIAYAKAHHPDLLADAENAIIANPEIITHHKFYKSSNPTGRKVRPKVKAKKKKSILAVLGGTSSPLPQQSKRTGAGGSYRDRE